MIVQCRICRTDNDISNGTDKCFKCLNVLFIQKRLKLNECIGKSIVKNNLTYRYVGKSIYDKKHLYILNEEHVQTLS
jgi:hypothetical protein